MSRPLTRVETDREPGPQSVSIRMIFRLLVVTVLASSATALAMAWWLQKRRVAVRVLAALFEPCRVQIPPNAAFPR